jgi:flagellin-specific chaperone FliS
MNAYKTMEYRQQEVMGASPLRLVVMAYDFTIRACDQQDFAQASKGISALRDALDYDYPEAAVGLFRLYQWCLNCIRKGDFRSAKDTLQELRAAWAAVEDHQNQIPGQVLSASNDAPAYAQAV